MNGTLDEVIVKEETELVEDAAGGDPEDYCKGGYHPVQVGRDTGAGLTTDSRHLSPHIAGERSGVDRRSSQGCWVTALSDETHHQKNTVHQRLRAKSSSLQVDKRIASQLGQASHVLHHAHEQRLQTAIESSILILAPAQSTRLRSWEVTSIVSSRSGTSVWAVPAIAVDFQLKPIKGEDSSPRLPIRPNPQ